MSGYTFRLLLIWVLLGFSLQLSAAPLILSQKYESAIGQHLFLLQENEGQLSADQAMDAFFRGKFRRADSDVISLGLNARPLWLIARVQNDTTFSAIRRLQIENSWLDRLDLYTAIEGHIEDHKQLGDLQPFMDRPVRQRFFAIDHNFAPGETLLLLRAQQAGPMIMPVYLLTLPDAEQRTLGQTFSYALLYGALGGLLLYNLILFAGLRDRSYLLYSLYVLAFMAVNISYTGHGYQLIWPDSPGWQRYANVVLMTAYVACGLLFAIRFLNLDRQYPRLALRLKVCTIAVPAMIAVLLIGQQYLPALYLLFTSLTLFPVLSIAMGISCLGDERRNATYFLLGATFAATGTLFTAATLEGVIPYSKLGLRALELGMFLDAILLASALAFRFREIDGRRTRAERLASIDPLTGILNRRAFQEQAEPIWNNAQRNKRSVAVILLDIDHFKKINDSHGHACGDRVLAHISLAMKRELRSFDLLARWGGEEFVLLLPETSAQDGVLVAERIRRRISELSHSWGLPEVSVSASLGVAAVIVNQTTLEELIEEADTQLYKAKASGRNKVCGPYQLSPISGSGTY